MLVALEGRLRAFEDGTLVVFEDDTMDKFTAEDDCAPLKADAARSEF